MKISYLLFTVFLFLGELLWSQAYNPRENYIYEALFGEIVIHDSISRSDVDTSGTVSVIYRANILYQGGWLDSAQVFMDTDTLDFARFNINADTIGVVNNGGPLDTVLSVFKIYQEDTIFAIDEFITGALPWGNYLTDVYFDSQGRIVTIDVVSLLGATYSFYYSGVSIRPDSVLVSGTGGCISSGNRKLIYFNTVNITDSIQVYDLDNLGSEPTMIYLNYDANEKITDIIHMVGYNGAYWKESYLRQEGSDVSLVKLEQETIAIHPNPAEHTLSIVNMNFPFEYTISDFKGRIILEGNSKGSSIDISVLDKGHYFLRINSGLAHFVKL